MVPERVRTVASDDVARLEAWVAQRRAELVRLTHALRRVRAEVEQGHDSSAVPHEAEADAAGALFPAVDGLLSTAFSRFESAVASARQDALTLVAVARNHAENLVLAEGGRIDHLPPVARPVGRVDGLRPPRKAAQLWHDLRDSGRPASECRSTAGDGPGDPVASVDLADRTPAQVYELFWERTERWRPVRDRLQRIASREG